MAREYALLGSYDTASVYFDGAFKLIEQCVQHCQQLTCCVRRYIQVITDRNLVQKWRQAKQQLENEAALIRSLDAQIVLFEQPPGARAEDEAPAPAPVPSHDQRPVRPVAVMAQPSWQRPPAVDPPSWQQAPDAPPSPLWPEKKERNPKPVANADPGVWEAPPEKPPAQRPRSSRAENSPKMPAWARPDPKPRDLQGRNKEADDRKRVVRKPAIPRQAAHGGREDPAPRGRKGSKASAHDETPFPHGDKFPGIGYEKDMIDNVERDIIDRGPGVCTPWDRMLMCCR